MQLTLLDMLACPACRSAFVCSDSEVDRDGLVVSGILECLRKQVPDRGGDLALSIRWMPSAALAALPRLLKPGGRITVTIYERKLWTFLNGKYLLRHLTRHLPMTVLLAAIKTSMPILFPLTDVLFRIPILGRILAFIIPVANYVHMTELDRGQRYQWTVLDTFDMLAPRYDRPVTHEEAERALAGAGIVKLRRLGNPGLNLVGERAG